MRRVLFLLGALLVLPTVAGAGASARPSIAAGAAAEPLLATRDTAGSGSELFFADPISLQPLGSASLRLDFRWGSFARSPDGSLLALSRNDGAELRFVRVDALQFAGTMTVPGDGFIRPVAWPSEHLLIALHDASLEQVLAIDPSTQNVLWQRSVPGSLSGVARSPGGIVLLAAPLNRIGPARVIAIGTDGSMRTVVLQRVLAGHRIQGTSSLHVKARTPGLAVDPAGNRAYIVGSREPVAEVDLASMQVRYHGGPLASRVPAKAINGPWRTATWLGNDALAVTGTNSSAGIDSRGRLQQSIAASGLTLIDTRTWSTRMLQQDATAATVVGDSMLAYGSSYDSATNTRTGPGLTVYDLDGTVRLHLFGQTPIYRIQTYNGLAYVWLPDANGHVVVIDPASGRTLADVTTPPLTVLLAGS